MASHYYQYHHILILLLFSHASIGTLRMEISVVQFVDHFGAD